MGEPEASESFSTLSPETYTEGSTGSVGTLHGGRRKKSRGSRKRGASRKKGGARKTRGKKRKTLGGKKKRRKSRGGSVNGNAMNSIKKLLN